MPTSSDSPDSAANGAHSCASKVSGTSAGARLDDAVAELPREPVAEVGGADLRDRQPAGGDDDLRCTDRTGIGVELEARRAVAHRVHPARLPPHHAAGIAFGAAASR